MLFDNRHHAGRLLAEELRPREFVRPVLIGVGPGGVEVASEIARELGWPLQPFRRGRARLGVTGRSVILVTDGLERADDLKPALEAVRVHRPLEVVVAVPVARQSAVEQLEREGVDVEVLATPEPFLGTPAYYQDFPGLTDEDVQIHLALANVAESEHVGER